MSLADDLALAVRGYLCRTGDDVPDPSVLRAVVLWVADWIGERSPAEAEELRRLAMDCAGFSRETPGLITRCEVGATPTHATPMRADRGA